MAAMWRFLRTGYNAVTGRNATGEELIYGFHLLLLWLGILLVLRSGKSFWMKTEGAQGTVLSKLIGIVLILWILFEVLYRTCNLDKDVGMLGGYLIATGCLLHQSSQPRPRFRVFPFFLVTVALFYGTALRHNAIFALLPMLFWLVWCNMKKRTTVRIVFGGLVLWFLLLSGLHCFNYGFLNAVRLYPLQERYYADIFMLNAKTGRFVPPPDTFGNRFDALDEELFRRYYVDDVFVETAFSRIDERVTPRFFFLKDRVLILPAEEFDKIPVGDFDEHGRIRYTDFRQRRCGLWALEESRVREQYPQDDRMLRDAWIQRILMDPVVYFRLKLVIFGAYLKNTGFFFFGLNPLMVSLLVFPLAVLGVFFKNRLDRSLFPALMLSWSAVLYLLPLFIFLTAITNTRYVYWFMAASVISVVLLGLESPLIRSLLKQTTSYWETKLRDIANH